MYVIKLGMDKRFNPLAEEMYKLYLKGFSLAQVGKAYSLSRQAVHILFLIRKLKLRNKPAPLPYLIYGGFKFTLRNNGYYGMTNGKRYSMHRFIWESERGKIPDGWDIHHIDGNKENNEIENLECLPKSEHTKKYSPHNNQYTKGRKK